MIRRGPVTLIALLLACGMSMAVGGVATAAPTGGMQTITTTQNFHLTQTLQRTNLCTGNPVDITETSNIVQHVLFVPSTGVNHVTFTEEDTFTGVDTITGVTYRGHAVNFGNMHTNNQPFNSSFAFTVLIRAVGSDGSVLVLHENSVFVVNPGGDITVNFDNVRLSCT